MFISIVMCLFLSDADLPLSFLEAQEPIPLFFHWIWVSTIAAYFQEQNLYDIWGFTWYDEVSIPNLRKQSNERDLEQSSPSAVYQRIQWNLETFSLQLRSPLTPSLDSRRTKEDLQWITMHKATPILSIFESFHTWHTSIILCKMVFRADRSWFHSHQATPEQMLCQWPPLEEVHDSSHYPIEFHKPFQICFLTTNLQQLSLLCSIQSWDDAAYLQLETTGIAVSCGDICNNGERHVITRDWRFMIDVCVVIVMCLFPTDPTDHQRPTAEGLILQGVVCTCQQRKWEGESKGGNWENMGRTTREKMREEWGRMGENKSKQKKSKRGNKREGEGKGNDNVQKFWLKTLTFHN